MLTLEVNRRCMQAQHVQEVRKRIARSIDVRYLRNELLPLVFDSCSTPDAPGQEMKILAIYEPVGLPPAEGARNQNAVRLLADADRRKTSARDHMLREELSRMLPISAGSSFKQFFEVVAKRRRP